MTDCPNGVMRDLLPDLLHDRLGETDRRTVEAHLAGCEDCRAELALLRDMRCALHRAPVVDVGTIVAAIPPYRAPARRSWGGWRAAAAVALIAVGGTSVAIANNSGLGGSVPAAPRAGSIASVAVATAPFDSSVSATERAGAVTAATPSVAPRELTEGGAVGDLSDGELSMLLDGIETLDAVPSAEVESTLPVTPVAPTAAARGAS
jgi:anti-sigma factor RsiW